MQEAPNLSDCAEQVEIRVGEAHTSPTKRRNVGQTREIVGNRAYLKPSQTDSQVAGSRDLRYMAKQARKLLRKYSQVATRQKIQGYRLGPTRLKCWNRKFNLRRVRSRGQKVNNLRRLSCKFHVDWSERKSSRKPMQLYAMTDQTDSQVDPRFQLAPTCESVWPGLCMRIHCNSITEQLYTFHPYHCSFCVWQSCPVTGPALILPCVIGTKAVDHQSVHVPCRFS